MASRRLGGVALLAALLFSGKASAQAIISDGTVKLGVDLFGQLNIPGSIPSIQSETDVGLRYLLAGGDEVEATADGCPCEGWGVGVSGGAFNGARGFANNSSGSGGLTSVSFTSAANSAVAVTMIQFGGSDLLKVTHDYHPSSVPGLYEVTVTIENVSGGDIDGDVRYRRLMDWDIEPTAFREFVTLQGWPAAKLLHTSNDGFCSSDVLSTCTSFGSGVDDANFVKAGPDDHGAQFDFSFGALAAGGTHSFTTFYGAAAKEADLLAGLTSVGAEIYSMAFCSGDPECPAAFAYGFKGVGGTPIGGVPEPATMGLLATGLVGLAGVGLRRRRQRSA